MSRVVWRAWPERVERVQAAVCKHRGGMRAPRPLPARRPPAAPRAGQQRAPAFLTLPLPSPAAAAAGGRAYFDLAGPEWSVDEELMAYGVDGRGDEVYTL